MPENLPGGVRGGRFISGEIISTDTDSITIKTPDGSTRIVFISESTEIKKSETASQDELVTEAQVTITGEINDDNTIDAASIQITP